MMNTISILLLYLFEAVIIWNYFNCIFKYKRKAGAILASFAAGYGILFAAYFVGSPFVNVLAFTVVNLLLAIFNYSCKAWSAVFHSAILSLFMFLSEIIVIFLSDFWSASSSPNNAAYSFFLNASLSKLVFLILCQLAAHIAMRENQSMQFPLKSLGLFSLPISTFILLNAIYHISQEIELPAKYDLVLCAASILLLFANIVVFIIYENLIKNNQKMTELQLARQKETIDHAYYKILQEQYENSRMLVHDIKNHLSAIDTLAAGDHPERVHEYVSSIYDHYQLSSRLPFSGNNMMDVICNQKQTQCAQEGISISFHNEGIQLNFMNDVDLCALLTNLLDNAIESCRISANKYIAVSFHSKNKVFVVISIQNSCDCKPKIVNHKLVTRKPNKLAHGIGMLSIEKSIKKYHGTMDYYYDEEQRIFHTNVAFPISCQEKEAG